MTAPWRSEIAALLLGAAILLLGNGLQSLLLPIRGGIEGFSTLQLGLLGSGYSVGFFIGCALCPRLIRRVGHIRTFAALAAIAAVMLLLCSLVLSPVAWISFRVGSGASFAGLIMVIESWLNERTDNAHRGRVFSLYMGINYVAVTLGQFLLPLADPAHFTLFALASMAMTLSLIPLSITTSSPPRPVKSLRLDLSGLYRVSPVGVVGALMVGMINSAFGTMGPVYARETGLPLTWVAGFMAAAIAGGAIAQYPLGRLSDKVDRRRVLIGGCLLGASMAAALAAADGLAGPQFRTSGLIGMLTLAAAFGMGLYSAYGLVVAHANDVAGDRDFVAVSRGLLTVWSCGAMVGPTAASLVMASVGPRGLFFFTACFHLVLAGFTLYRISRRASPPEEQRRNFVATASARTTPAAAALDPRATSRTPPKPDPAAEDGEASGG